VAPLPNCELATIDLRKLRDYCLDSTHPRGRHKARVFRETLGIDRTDAAWLRDALLQNLPAHDAVVLNTDRFGTRWRVDISISRQERSVMIRTIWILRTDEKHPRLVTCWVP
jgi:hypothetical protein